MQIRPESMDSAIASTYTCDIATIPSTGGWGAGGKKRNFQFLTSLSWGCGSLSHGIAARLSSKRDFFFRISSIGHNRNDLPIFLITVVIWVLSLDQVFLHFWFSNFVTYFSGVFSYRCNPSAEPARPSHCGCTMHLKYKIPIMSWNGRGNMLPSVLHTRIWFCQLTKHIAPNYIYNILYLCMGNHIANRSRLIPITVYDRVDIIYAAAQKPCHFCDIVSFWFLMFFFLEWILEM